MRSEVSVPKLKELAVVLKEDYDIELSSVELEKLAYSLVGYFALLIKLSRSKEF